MKQICTSILAILLLARSTHAQTQTAAPATSGRPSSARQIPRMGKMYGKLLDNKTGKAIGDASVSLVQAQNGKKVLVGNQIAEGNGEFSLDNLPMVGQFELVITAVGYKDYHQQAAFDM